MTDSLSRNRIRTCDGTTTRSASDSIGVTRIYGRVTHPLRSGWDNTSSIQTSRNFLELTGLAAARNSFRTRFGHKQRKTKGPALYGPAPIENTSLLRLLLARLHLDVDAGRHLLQLLEPELSLLPVGAVGVQLDCLLVRLD